MPQSIVEQLSQRLALAKRERLANHWDKCLLQNGRQSQRQTVGTTVLQSSLRKTNLRQYLTAAHLRGRVDNDCRDRLIQNTTLIPASCKNFKCADPWSTKKRQTSARNGTICRMFVTRSNVCLLAMISTQKRQRQRMLSPSRSPPSPSRSCTIVRLLL